MEEARSWPRVRFDELDITGWDDVGDEPAGSKQGKRPGYGRGARNRIPGYTPEAVLGALDGLDVGPPPGSSSGVSASGMFAGYLVLDALVANMDRHDENWGLLLAPSDNPLLA